MKVATLQGTLPGITPAYGDAILCPQRTEWEGAWDKVAVFDSVRCTADIVAARLSDSDVLTAWCDPTDGKVKGKRRTASGEWLPAGSECLDFGGTMIDLSAVHCVDNSVDLIARGWDTNLYHRRFSLHGPLPAAGTPIPKIGIITGTPGFGV